MRSVKYVYNAGLKVRRVAPGRKPGTLWSAGSLGLWFTATTPKYIYDFTAILQVNEGAILGE